MTKSNNWNYCINCCQHTKHSILFEKNVTDSNDDIEYGTSNFQVLECNGCETIFFKETYISNVSFDEDEYGNIIPDSTVHRYPNPIDGYKPLGFSWKLPQKIKDVYDQTILAFRGNSYLLTGVGFRAVIEAICNAEGILGRNLEIKINKLVINKLITDNEASRLHSVRFLGNDSVHEMEIPNITKLRVVLDIIDNLIKNLYLIDEDAKHVLDTIVKDYKHFEYVLNHCLQTCKLGEIKNLREFLGKSIRRVPNLSFFEAELIRKINKNEYVFLQLSSIEIVKNEPCQYYKLMKTDFGWQAVP